MLLKALQAGVKRESSGATSVSLSLGDCVLDDLRTRLDEDRVLEDEEDEEDEEDDEGSTHESSVDAVAVPKKEPTDLMIRRYTAPSSVAANKILKAQSFIVNTESTLENFPEQNLQITSTKFYSS